MEVIGYPDYLIYEDGRVWSKPRKDSRGNQRKGKFLKHVKNQKGYHRVGLSRDGKQKRFFVSRLVAIHFIPNPENKPEVDHINRDIDNNHVSNLRWATRFENMENIGMRTDNTSGHEHISYNNGSKVWVFQYQRKKHKVHEYFKTKNDALWFKIIFLAKLKYMS